MPTFQIRINLEDYPPGQLDSLGQIIHDAVGSVKREGDAENITWQSPGYQHHITLGYIHSARDDQAQLIQDTVKEVLAAVGHLQVTPSGTIPGSRWDGVGYCHGQFTMNSDPSISVIQQALQAALKNKGITCSYAAPHVSVSHEESGKKFLSKVNLRKHGKTAVRRALTTKELKVIKKASTIAKQLASERGVAPITSVDIIKGLGKYQLLEKVQLQAPSPSANLVPIPTIPGLAKTAPPKNHISNI